MDKSKWEYKKLGEVGDIITGGTPPTKDARNYSSNDYCFVKPSDLTDERILFLDDSEFHVSSYAYSNSRKLPKGSVLVCCIGSIGKLGILNVDATCNQQINAIIPKSGFDSKYLAYCLLASKGVMLNIANAPVVPIINKSQFSNIEIKTCPIADQQRIVAELDCLNEMIAVKQEQLKEFDKLAQSIFYDMFGDPVSNEKGWKQCLLKDVSKTITDGDHMPPPKSDSGVPFVTISNVDKDTRQIDFSSTFYVPRDYYDNIPESKKPQVGDVLYTVTGSYGIPILIKEEKEFCFQRHIGLIRPNKDIEPTFLCMWAGCHSVKNYADRYATGVAQKTVSLKVLRNFPIIVPHLSLQQQFADKISAIEAQKELVKQSIAETQALLDYTMDKYFG